MSTRKAQPRIVASLACALAGAALSHACQSSPGTPGGAAMCTFGETIGCGPENACESTCLPDLSAYGPCICGDAGADAGDGGKKDAR